MNLLKRIILRIKKIIEYPIKRFEEYDKKHNWVYYYSYLHTENERDVHMIIYYECKNCGTMKIEEVRI